MILIWTCIFTVYIYCIVFIYRKQGLNEYEPDICSKNLNKLFIKYKYYFVSFLDLNDCFALTEIGSLKNDQMIGICILRADSYSTIENCKTSCLHAFDSRCFGVEHYGREYYTNCIQYTYTATPSRYRCYFSRGASHFFHKGNHIVSNFIKFKFLFNVSNHAPVRKDAWRSSFELITYKVEKHAEFNILTVTYRYMQWKSR